MPEMKLKFQVELAPDEARSKILKAFEGAFASEEASTNRAGFAAKSLGIDVSVLYRFINKLGLKSSIASLRAEMNYWRERANVAEARTQAPIGYVVATANGTVRAGDMVAVQMGGDPYDKPAPKEAERKSNGIGSRFSNLDLDDEEK